MATLLSALLCFLRAAILSRTILAHSASTIRRYMVPRQGSPRGKQTWRAFINNHSEEVWTCDLLTQYTAFYAVAYVFVIMEISSRRIGHANVTTDPTLPWVKQQIRDATAWDQATTTARGHRRRFTRSPIRFRKSTGCLPPRIRL